MHLVFLAYFFAKFENSFLTRQEMNILANCSFWNLLCSFLHPSSDSCFWKFPAISPCRGGKSFPFSCKWSHHLLLSMLSEETRYHFPFPFLAFCKEILLLLSPPGPKLRPYSFEKTEKRDSLAFTFHHFSFPGKSFHFCLPKSCVRVDSRAWPLRRLQVYFFFILSLMCFWFLMDAGFMQLRFCLHWNTSTCWGSSTAI